MALPNPNAQAYDRWFAIADADRDGRVTGKDAVGFFAQSGLPREELAKVWDLANSARQGFLDRYSFHRAMDIIAIAQQGIPITKENYIAAMERGSLPLPRLAGYNDDGTPEGGLDRSPTWTSGQSGTNGTSATGMGGAALGNSSTAGEVPPAWDNVSKPVIVQDMGNRNLTGKKGVKDPTRKVLPSKLCTSIIDGLKSIYFAKVRPLEDAYKFGHFFSPLLSESDFEAKPSVLLLGQYSTGKTTFIKYLLGRDYPGTHIGPEPTTDRFVAVFHGMEERRIPGNTLAVQPDKPYQALANFGTGFLSRFEGSQCPAKLLEEISIIDTPGVLSGEKQRIERNYNFVEICEWFAARTDLIFLLFDPYKLDISDEFKQVITVLKGHDDKVRVVLNKADQVDQQQLMRVYGALMWSLGKVFKSPEVCKVYVGSFNSEAPINEDKNPHGKSLFEAEQKQLLDDLYEIPHRSLSLLASKFVQSTGVPPADRKINEFVKRVRAAKIHILLMGHLRAQMPSMFGKEKAQKKILENLAENFGQVQREYHLPKGDFPDVHRFREILSSFDLLAFPKVTKGMSKQIEDVLTIEIPALVKQFDNPFP
ncbi:MAG: hypothetical protein WDW38_009759 [Sanguina aurantia]